MKYAPLSILDKPQREFTVIDFGFRGQMPDVGPTYRLKTQGTWPGSNYHYWQFELVQKEENHE